MEHSPNSQPMDRRRWVGFDAFDAIIAEALDEIETEPVDDNVVDLNANVIEFEPPDNAA